MKNQNSLGLDELMIINPTSLEAALPGSTGLFLGEDGTVYQVQGYGSEAALGETGLGEARLGEFFLGDDGNLYQLQGLRALMTAEQGEASVAGVPRLPRCFLGEDGTLYEIRNG